MRRLAGQVVLAIARPLHRLLTVLVAVAVVVTAGLGVLAWRVAQRPLDITWIARRIEAAANPDDAARITVASAALAWEGWRLGLDHPLDIRLAGITAARPGQPPVAVIPSAEISLSFAWLLRGRLMPRAIGIDGARLRVLRGTDGTTALDLGAPGDTQATATQGADPPENPFNALLAQFSAPAADDHTRTAPDTSWSQLSRVRISGAEVTVIDRQLGATWRAPRADIDLRRRALGGIDADLDVILALGDHSTRITAVATVPAGRGDTRVQANFSRLAPAALALAAPGLAILKTVDAPVAGTIDLSLGPALTLRRAALRARMGPGTVLVAQGALPVAGATLDLATDTTNLLLNRLHVELVGADGGHGPVIDARGAAHRAGARYIGNVALDIDQVAVAELGRYWPRGAAGNARDWVTTNLTAGTVRAAHLDLGLAMSPGQPGQQTLALTAATGQLTGDDVTIWWLRPAPPIEHAQAILSVISPDELDITAATAREAGGQLALRNTTLKITGLAQEHQLGSIDGTITGPIEDALTLLRHPRLRLLSRHPIDFSEPAGKVAVRLSLVVPLENKVTIDQIPIHAQGQLTDLHLGRIAAGRDLDQGSLDLDVTNDGLKLGGAAVLAGVPAMLGIKMDFRAGPPSQVLRAVSVSGDVTARQLAELGLDTAGAFGGTASLQANLAERRDGSGTATLHGDLQAASLAVPPLGWRRGPGTAATGDAVITLDHDRIASLDRIALDGDGLSVLGHAEFTQGALSRLMLDRVVLGATRAAGDIRFPPAQGDPIRATVTGSSLDLSGLFGHRDPKPPRPTDETPGRPWAADLKMEKILLGAGRGLADVTAGVENDGRLLHRAVIAGRTIAGSTLAGSTNDRGETFRIAITPNGPQGRDLSANASDSGALLRAFNLVDSLQGGRFAMTGHYDDTRPDHPLTGIADLTEFRLRDAPTAARVLKAMTLYGVVDLLTGPGLGFSRMVAPFRMTEGALDLLDARAFSPSLGVTAKGRVDLDRQAIDMQGTVVPAYFFNTLPGKMPLLGRLFSPEPGGGVFAATYAVKGSIDDPAVSVNPLAALTPGFLRGVFGIFGK